MGFLVQDITCWAAQPSVSGGEVPPTSPASWALPAYLGPMWSGGSRTEDVQWVCSVWL